MTNQPLHSDRARLAIDGHRFTKSDSVTLIVGSQKDELLVHANCIARSPFFKTALKKEWREGRERTIKLPEDDCETVTNYLRFVYGDRLPTSQIHDTTRKRTSEELRLLNILLAKLYIFGNKLIDSGLKQAVIREIHKLSLTSLTLDGRRCIPDVYAVNIIYSGTLEGDSARSLLIDLYISHGDGSSLHELYNSCFVLDLLKRVLATTSNGTRANPHRSWTPQIQNYLAFQ